MTTQDTTVKYAVQSVARDVKHRTHRAQLPAHLHKKHYVLDTQTRLVAGRRLLLTEAVFQRNLAELREKAAMHILEVRTLDGRLVDLSTLEVAPAMPLPLMPHPKLDSVADDKQVGQYIPPYVGDDTAMPQVLAHGEKPELLKRAEAESALDNEAADAELDAALEAQGLSVEEEAAAPAGPKTLSSGDQQNFRKDKKNRR